MRRLWLAAELLEKARRAIELERVRAAWSRVVMVGCGEVRRCVVALGKL